MRKRGKLGWLAAAAMVAGLVWWWRPEGSGYEPSGRVPPRAPSELFRGRDGTVPAAAERLPPARELEADAKSLRGTEADGALPVDEAGHLVLSPDVIRFFDYFFLTSGEIPDAAIRRRVEAEIAVLVDEPARSEALDLLERYMSYRDAAAGLYARQGPDDSVVDRIEAIAQLRSDLFGDAAALLFGPDLEHAAVAAEMQKVASDPDLSEDERDLRLVELEQALPEEVRAARAAALAAVELQRDEAALRAAGGDQEEVRALREQRFGVEAADRLGELDRRRDEWRERVDEYRRRRSEIEADQGLSEAQRRARVEQLTSERFTETERKRVAALDRIELSR